MSAVSIAPEHSGKAAKILLNALPLQAGGGLQKTITLFRAFKSLDVDLSRFTAIVRRGTELEEEARRVGFDVVTSGPATSDRLQFEALARWRFPAGTLCFTLSGPPMLGTAGHFLNVVECAYSNLLYTEIDFWSEFSGLQRFRKEATDLYRRKALRSADFWLFQTKILAERAIKVFRFPADRVRFVPTSPNTNVSPSTVNERKRLAFDARIPAGTRFLFLNGPSSNKRLHLFPAVLEQAAEQGLTNAVAVTTLPDDHPYTRRVRAAFSERGLLDRLCNVGRVHPGDVASCIAVCDAVCTLSVLESFSNNFVEAWRMEKPLIATCADWAVDVAGDAAVYVDVATPNAAGHEIADLMQNSTRLHHLIENGRRRLSSFATPESKLLNYLEILSEALSAGSCPSDLRSRIIW